ncbi:MAG: MCP four helix bundle domain-containing protein [Bradymonadaceae bacterium]
MTLRTRLLIGYGYLVLLVVAVAGTATVGFFDLGGRIGTILNDNVEAIEATNQLTEAIERQDSATLSALMAAEAESSELGEANEAFQSALSKVRSVATGDEERQIIGRIEQTYETYRQARQKLLATDHDRPLAAYQRQVFPKFQTVKNAVDELLELNQRAIVEAERASQSDATRFGVAMAALVAIGLLSFVVLTRALQRRLLDRLAEIKDAADAIDAGNLKRRVSVNIQDELGVVASQFNEALDKYAELERHVDGRLAEMRQDILGLFDTFDIEGAFFNCDGRLVASTLEIGRKEFPDDLRQRIVDAGRGLIEGRDPEAPGGEATTLELDDGTEVSVELVHARGRRLVGWLARIPG